MKYRVTLIEHEEGVSVSCPALRGCHSQGKTREDALATIREAIREWLAAESGQAGAEHAAEDVGEEVWEPRACFEMVGAAGRDKFGPMLEFGLPDRRLVREIERPHLLAQDFRVEERFGFDSHLPGKRLY